MILAADVHGILKRHTIGDGSPIVVDVEKSRGSWVVDALTGKKYLDCYSQFASQPVGWNHPAVEAAWAALSRAARVKIANSDLYCQDYADFVRDFAEVTPDFKHYFFIDGGTLGVENALKAAFDWKAQKLGMKTDTADASRLSVIHLQEAFHGRSGYTLSLTNTAPVKTKWFPKFNWPRILNPKIHGEMRVEEAEALSLAQAEDHLKRNPQVAAIILEPIQGEGGDNHFRAEYFRGLRAMADQYEAMLIFDEVQTGVGLTGRMWAYEHFGVVPDMLAFGKKTQVCGFCTTDRIDDVPNNVFTVSGRINSTWGGNVVDMVRFMIYKGIIVRENLVQNAAHVGSYFLMRLKTVVPELLDVRGLGLMIAFSFASESRRNEVLHHLGNDMLALKSGSRSIRLRPPLTFSVEEAEQAVEFVRKAVSA